MTVIKTPGEVIGFLLKDINSIGFIRYINKYTDKNPEAEDSAEPASKPKFTKNAIAWMSSESNWDEFIRLIRSYAFWNSASVAETKEQCKALLDFNRKYPDLARQVFDTKTFVIANRENDLYYWNTIETLASQLAKQIKDIKEIGFQKILASRNGSEQILNMIQGLLDNLPKVHHTAKSPLSPLYNKDEQKDCIPICEWYLTEEYWVEMTYESLSSWHAQQAPGIKALYNIVKKIYKMMEIYPTGSFPIYNQALDKNDDDIVVGYSVAKNDRDEIIYFVKGLRPDGSIIEIKCIPDAENNREEADRKDEPEPETKPDSVSEIIPENISGAWDNFNTSELF